MSLDDDDWIPDDALPAYARGGPVRPARPAADPDPPPFARGSGTSREAAESMAGASKGLRARVLAYVQRRGAAGATTAEAEDALGLRHQTASPRFWELHLKGDIVATARRRKTGSGRDATVYVGAAWAAAEGPAPGTGA